MAGIRRASASGSACNSASSSSTSRIHGCGVTILSSSSFMMYQWELDHEERPVFWTIVDRDGSLVGLNDTVCDGEAQSSPRAHRLSGEEWIKDTFFEPWRHRWTRNSHLPFHALFFHRTSDDD